MERVGRRARRWPYVTAIIVLAVAALALGGLYAYSTNSAQQWSAQAAKDSSSLSSVTAERDDLLTKYRAVDSQLSDATSKLNDTTSKLNQANDQIRSLANDKAQLGDKSALQQETEVTLAQLVGASQKVSGDLRSCIANLQTLQTYLQNAASYDPASLDTVMGKVNTGCNNAQSESDALTKTIQGLGK